MLAKRPGADAAVVAAIFAAIVSGTAAKEVPPVGAAKAIAAIVGNILVRKSKKPASGNPV